MRHDNVLHNSLDPSRRETRPRYHFQELRGRRYLVLTQIFQIEVDDGIVEETART